MAENPKPPATVRQIAKNALERRQRWQAVFRHPAIVQLMRDAILGRAQQPALFPALLNALPVVEWREDSEPESEVSP